MFHGVGGKYGFDAPTESLAPWHRLFFVNRRRLNNCIAAGALDADSPAIRLIGMPKVDALVDGSLNRERILASLGLPADRPTVLYAPTWSPASSLNKLGVALLHRLRMMPVNVIVKLHDRSCDLRPQYSGGVDWPAALQTHLAAGTAVLASTADICPYLVAVGRDDHGPQLSRLRIPAPRSPAGAHSCARADCARQHPSGLRAVARGRIRVDHARSTTRWARSNARWRSRRQSRRCARRSPRISSTNQERQRRDAQTPSTRRSRSSRFRSVAAGTRSVEGVWSPALRPSSLPA